MPYHCSPRYAARRAAFTPFSGLDVLSGLISALDDKPATSRCAVPTARPNFDVYETKDSYVLEAELPGVSDKKSINLQFTDAQTLSVKGAIGRFPRKEQDSEEKKQDTAAEQTNEKSNDTEMSDDTLNNEPLVQIEGLVRKESPALSYHATVEDDQDDDDKSDFEVVNTPRTNTPAPAPVVPGGPAADEKQKEAAPAASEEAAKVAVKEGCKRRCGNGRKYWVSERSTGVFHRTFSFSGLVDQDAVKAHLENGLLTVVVPKRQPYVTRVNIE